MPQKVIRFKGIDRKINEFQASGESEDLINLRPNAGGGLSAVKPKTAIETDVPYDKVYEHKWGSHCNYIASSNGYIHLLNSEDESEITDSFSGCDVEFSSVGNILVIYNKDENRQEVYKYEDGSYSPYYLSLPTLTEANAVVNYKPDNFNTTITKIITSADVVSTAENVYNSALADCVSEFYHKNPNGLCGAVILGCAYELEDGNEIWSTGFVLADITKAEDYSAPSYLSSDYYSIKITGGDSVYYELAFDVTIPFENVRKINIYASRPVLPYKFDKFGYEPNGHTIPLFKKIPLEEMNLDGQLMFYQKSIDPTYSAIVELNFGKSQAGERILNVDAGCTERVGMTIAYNNRFHCFQSQSNHIIQRVTQSFWAAGADEADGALSQWMAYIETKNGWILLDDVHEFRETEAQDFIYPLAGIKRLAFVRGNKQSLPYTDMFYVDMKDSTAYNYSYAFDVVPQIESASRFREIVSSYGQILGDKLDNGFDKTFPMDEEYNVINVSAQFNPYVFPIKNSYSFGGEILDISTAYNPITATQIGQYPLTVFTSNGIYAMEQGSGDVLYNNILPLQPHIISGKACATPYGIFFVSAGRLYILSGREVADITLPLDGMQDDDLKLNDSYQALLQNEDGKFHFFWAMLTHIPFAEFTSDVVLTYDQLHNELYISSRDSRESCSYVFNLNTKQYHRISKRYLASYNGARQIVEIDRNTKNLVDLYSESEGKQHILLQSRPMTLDAFYSHIQRAILLVDAKLEDSDNLCLSVFASDNLNDWKCIISSQKRNVILRQIRTNKSAKSYKDYIILISGTVSTATDISDLLADYTTVNRRLG